MPLALLRSVFALEGTRLVALARLGREPGAEMVLEDVDARLGAALEALEARGARYPAHALAERYQLSQADYLVLQLALLPWHGGEAVAAATRALAGDGQATDRPRASHAVALALPGHTDWPHALGRLRELTVVAEGLVVLQPTDDGDDDPIVTLGLAVQELLGLS